MPLFKLTKIQKRRISLFFVSFCIACGLWFFYSLSTTYHFSTTLYIKWTDVPSDLKKNIPATDTVSVAIKGNGWNLLFDKLNTNDLYATISLKKLGDDHFLPLQSVIKQLNQSKGFEGQVLSIQPDTFFFNRSAWISKKVPVKFKYRFDFEKFYGFSGPIIIQPDTVTLKGEAAEIQKIRFIETQVLSESDVNSTIETLIPFKNNPKSNFQISPGQVKVIVPVGKHTEKLILVEPEIRNRPDGFNINLLPSRVKVTITTTLNNYPKINAEQIRAFVDLQKLDPGIYRRLPIKFGSFPNFIKIVKVEPQTVDLILYP